MEPSFSSWIVYVNHNCLQLWWWSVPSILLCFCLEFYAFCQSHISSLLVYFLLFHSFCFLVLRRVSQFSSVLRMYPTADDVCRERKEQKRENDCKSWLPFFFRADLKRESPFVLFFHSSAWSLSWIEKNQGYIHIPHVWSKKDSGGGCVSIFLLFDSTTQNDKVFPLFLFSNNYFFYFYPLLFSEGVLYETLVHVSFGHAKH